MARSLERDGNRGPTAAPQNLYRTVGTDERGRRDCWVAIAVETDEQWEALVEGLGRPAWAVKPELSVASGRAEGHDVIDRELGTWCGSHTAQEVVDLLWPAGVPVAVVNQPHHQGEVPQLQARRYFEVVEHPVAGAARHSTLPMRFSKGPSQLHRRHAPLLGEHNTEILTGLGLSVWQITTLENDGVIGREPVEGGR